MIDQSCMVDYEVYSDAVESESMVVGHMTTDAIPGHKQIRTVDFE